MNHNLYKKWREHYEKIDRHPFKFRAGPFSDRVLRFRARRNFRDGCGDDHSSPDGSDGCGVELTIKDSEITDIKVLEHQETPGYADAMDKLRETMIATNQIDVDMVSGATLSSTGFLQAVNNAFEKTGAASDLLVQRPQRLRRRRQTTMTRM